jgi:transposase
VGNLETAGTLWFGERRKAQTADRFFVEESSAMQRSGSRRLVWTCGRRIAQWAPPALIVYDKFHVMQHLNETVDEVRRAEFFRKSRRMRRMVKGKAVAAAHSLGLSGWRKTPTSQSTLQPKIFKAYLLKESVDRLWPHGSGSAL